MVLINEQKQTRFQIIPDFMLRSSEGRFISPSMYRQKQNLVLVFIQYYQCSSCYPLVADLKKFYQDIREMNTELLLIINDDEQCVKNLQQIWMFPFPLLSDPNDIIAQQFLGVNINHRPGLLIVDRYGLVWKHYIGINTINIKVQNILKWLDFIEMQCPECGIMDEPTYDKNEMNLSMIKI